MQVFEIFDKKKNNVIEFGEFVQALSVFHPKAPLAEKAECTFGVPPLLSCACCCRSITARALSCSITTQLHSASTIWGTRGRSIEGRCAPCCVKS